MIGFHGGVEDKDDLLSQSSGVAFADAATSAICKGLPGQDKQRVIQIEQRVDPTVSASEFYSVGKGCYAVAE